MKSPENKKMTNDPKEKVKDFIKDYQTVAEKHRYDFYARIDISRNGGIEPSKHELDQIKKAIDRILFQYKVRLTPTISIVEVTKKDEEK